MTEIFRTLKKKDVPNKKKSLVIKKNRARFIIMKNGVSDKNEENVRLKIKKKVWSLCLKSDVVAKEVLGNLLSRTSFCDIVHLNMHILPSRLAYTSFSS